MHATKPTTKSMTKPATTSATSRRPHTIPPAPPRGTQLPRSAQTLLAPLVGTGALMAVYLLVRPYGDAGDAGNSVSSAQAFASTGWVVAHLAGMGALASLARLALRMNDLVGSPLTRFARWTGLAGLGAVLPAYGAETIGLHVLGQRALDGDSAALVAAEAIRASAAFTGLLGVGLLLLAVSGVCVAAAWRSWAASVETGVPGRRWHRWAAWPLSIAAALLLPQFFVPPAGRMAFGVVYALAAALWVAAVLATRSAPQTTGVSPSSQATRS